MLPGALVPPLMEATVPLDPIPPLPAVVLLTVCLMGVAFFSSSEAAILSVNRIRVRNLAEKGDARAVALQRLREQHDRLLGTILLLENFLIIIASSVWTVVSSTWLEAWHMATPGGLLGASLLMTLVIVLLAEITPKTFAASYAEAWSLKVSRVILACVWFSGPVVKGFTFCSNALIGMLRNLFGLRPEAATPFVTDDEIRMLADVGHEEGTIETDENEMIHGVLELGDTTVREIMVPRIDMNCLSADATLEEALQMVISSGHSRIPVYRDTSDNIVGILYVKDLLSLLARTDRPRSLPSAYVRPATYIPESKRVDDLLTDMRRMKIHMAVVMDEYGGTAGLVTIEDILEEIVGDIQDEFDAEEDLPVKHQEDGSILVDGRLPIYEVNDLLGADLPTEDFDTIGGFVVGQLGRAPIRGEEVRYDTLRLVADAVEARRLVRVQIIREAAP